MKNCILGWGNLKIFTPSTVRSVLLFLALARRRFRWFAGCYFCNLSRHPRDDEAASRRPDNNNFSIVVGYFTSSNSILLYPIIPTFLSIHFIIWCNTYTFIVIYRKPSANEPGENSRLHVPNLKGKFMLERDSKCTNKDVSVLKFERKKFSTKLHKTRQICTFKKYNCPTSRYVMLPWPSPTKRNEYFVWNADFRQQMAHQSSLRHKDLTPRRFVVPSTIVRRARVINWKMWLIVQTEASTRRATYRKPKQPIS